MEDLFNEIINKAKISKGRLVTYDGKTRIDEDFEVLYPSIMNLGHQLTEKGINKGSTVGIVFSNNLNTVLLDLALICCGATSFPVNEIEAIHLFHEKNGADTRIILSEADDLHICVCKSLDIEVIYVEKLREEIQYASTELIPNFYEQNDIVAYKTTSGSTGRPKIIGHLKAALNNSLLQIQRLFEHTYDDNILVFLPLELLQQRYWIYSAICFNFKVTVVPKEMVFYALQTEKPTVLMGIPYLYETMMKEFRNSLTTTNQTNDSVGSDDIKNASYREKFQAMFGGNIRYLWTGSAPISTDCLEFYHEMQLPLLQGYGMNETCIISKNFPGKNKVGTVGPVFPNIELKLDENDQILVRPKYPICTEYAFDSGDNSCFQEDGFFATGDTGAIDEDGYLTITGRIKDLIVLSTSKKVNPRYVEEQIELHPEIEKCIVFGDNKPFLVALIQPSASSVSSERIRDIIDEYNVSARTEEKVLRFHILEQKITTNERFISNQNKIKRNEVFSEYENIINVLNI